MPIFKARFGGQMIPIEADTPEHAALLARVKFANLSSVGRVEDELGAEAAADVQREKILSRGTSPTQQLAGARLGVAEQMPAGSAAMGLGAMGVAAAPALSLGLAKDAAIYGAAEGAEKMLGLPPWMGEAVGLVSPARAAKNLVTRLLTRGGGKVAAETAATAAAKTAEEKLRREAMERAARATERKLEIEAEKLAEKKAARLSREQLARERNELLRENLERRAPRPTTPPRAVPEPAGAPASVEATAPKLAPSGQRAPATNLGGKAKPGPEPTKPEDLEETLRRSIEDIKARKAAAGTASPLRQPRLEVGAQRVGRDVGLTKEQVRVQTGPRLNEALGEASPILPDVPFGKIVDTLKALPKTGGYREAYVARATSGKTMAQVENIRRTLERLGLLVPLGAAGVAASGGD